MTTYLAEPGRGRKVTVPALRAMKGARRIVAITAYDVPTASLAQAAGVDLLLVGDSLGMVVLGSETTLEVTLDDMVHHARAVARGAQTPLLVGDMPWLSYHTGTAEAVSNAGRFVREGGMNAVKVEGGRRRLPVIRALLDAEIPVLGHLGLTPQSVNALGGFRVQGRSEAAAEELLEDARALEREGVFAMVLESMPPDVAAAVSREVTVPTIGIGAGAGCDGQILVFHDALGWAPQGTRLPRFVRRFADLWGEGLRGLEEYAESVRDGSYPAAEESYPELNAATGEGDS